LNSRRRLFGVPILLWISVAAVIATIATGTILSTILNNPSQVMISWNQSIPSNTIVGHYYNWSINTRSPKTYDAPHLTIFVNSASPLTDWNIVNITITSVATGETRNLLNSPSGPLSGGHMWAYNTVLIPQGSKTPEILGTWQFNSKAPLTKYTIQASLSPIGFDSNQNFDSNIINATTTLNS
jgi:hypothetical protein